MTLRAWTEDEIDNLREFHEDTNTNRDGTCVRWRRNGATKRWKRTPKRFEIPVKNGMYYYSRINEDMIRWMHPSTDCFREKGQA